LSKTLKYQEVLLISNLQGVLMAGNPDMSIVVPVFGSDITLTPLYQRTVAAVSPVTENFEMILVDDCGPGKPWEIIGALAKQDSRVIGLKLAKNFGQHSAIKAGVDLARGQWIVVMDCDLQDRPEEIPRFWGKTQEGCDVVVGRRLERQDGIMTRMFSRIFHGLLRLTTRRQSDAAQSNFGIYSRRVIDKINTLPEQPFYLPLLVRRAGFDVTPIDVEHDKRPYGKSGYTFCRRLSLAVDILASSYDYPFKMFPLFGFFNHSRRKPLYVVKEQIRMM